MSDDARGTRHDTPPAAGIGPQSDAAAVGAPTPLPALADAAGAEIGARIDGDDLSRQLVITIERPAMAEGAPDALLTAWRGRTVLGRFGWRRAEETWQTGYPAIDLVVAAVTLGMTWHGRPSRWPHRAKDLPATTGATTLLERLAPERDDLPGWLPHFRANTRFEVEFGSVGVLEILQRNGFAAFELDPQRRRRRDGSTDPTPPDPVDTLRQRIEAELAIASVALVDGRRVIEDDEDPLAREHVVVRHAKLQRLLSALGEYERLPAWQPDQVLATIRARLTDALVRVDEARRAAARPPEE